MPIAKSLFYFGFLIFCGLPVHAKPVNRNCEFYLPPEARLFKCIVDLSVRPIKGIEAKKYEILDSTSGYLIYTVIVTSDSPKASIFMGPSRKYLDTGILSLDEYGDLKLLFQNGRYVLFPHID